jgi:hypothetical protein
MYQIENDDEKQKKKQEYENHRPDRKFSSKWQTERPWIVLAFKEEKNVMTCLHAFNFSKMIKSVTPS